MGFFSNLFTKSTFFSSEFTDKSMMSLTEVMSAHANWKSRLGKFIDGTLGYSLDPDMLAEADDTELGRWILQSDELQISEEKRGVLKQLHQANVEMHGVASAIATLVHAGNQAGVASLNNQFVATSRQVMVLLRNMG